MREVTTQATIEEKRKLRKGFRRFDMILFTVTAIIGLNTLGNFATNAGQSLTWLLISAITFFLPFGLLIAELGSTFTQEGGLYGWCKLAGGRFFGALAATFYWITLPFWIGAVLSIGAIEALKTLWFGNPNFLFGGSLASDAVIEIVIALAFIWGTTWCASIPLQSGKWLTNVGGFLKLALIALFVILGLIIIFSGFATGKHVIKDFNDFMVTNRTHILSKILPILMFLWIGFELQNGAAEEMDNPQRDVPRSILISGATTVIAYAAFIIVLLSALPERLVENPGLVGGYFKWFQDAAGIGILPGPVATIVGWLVAVGFIVALAASGSTWLIGANRTYAMAVLDRNAPRRLGRFSVRYGTPLALNILSGVIASLVMVSVILISAFSGGNIVTLLNLVLDFVLALPAIVYLFILVSFPILRYKYPKAHRPFKVPGGMIGAWIVTLLPLFYAAFATYFILYPNDFYLSYITTGLPIKVDRTMYEFSQLIPLALIIVLTIILRLWGQRETGNSNVEAGPNAKRAGELGAGASQ